MRFCNLLAAAEAVPDLAVVAQIDVSLQTLEQRIMVVIQVAVVDDEGIELIAGFEAAYLSEEAACRLCGDPERLGQREKRTLVILLIVQLAHLNGINHHLEDAQVVTAADIAAESHAQPSVEELSDRRHARCQVEIRRRTVRHHYPTAFHQFLLLV